VAEVPKLEAAGPDHRVRCLRWQEIGTPATEAA
jgi:hypothetical protein